jgi:hypothetical protein
VLVEKVLSLPLDRLLHELAGYLQSDLQLEREIYTLVVPVEPGRKQEVAVTVRPDAQGRAIVDLISTVGQVYAGVDPWHLLQVNGQTTFCRITVANQLIHVIASQLLDTAQPEEVLVMLREVAMVADQVERQYFFHDTY